MALAHKNAGIMKRLIQIRRCLLFKSGAHVSTHISICMGAGAIFLSGPIKFELLTLRGEQGHAKGTNYCQHDRDRLINFSRSLEAVAGGARGKSETPD